MSSAKAALESDTRVLAFEAGRKYGLRVNSISAGPWASRAASAIGIIDDTIRYTAANAPLQEHLTADEVANTAAFLASPLGTGITGTIVYVDKGYHTMGKATEERYAARRVAATASSRFRPAAEAWLRAALTFAAWRAVLFLFEFVALSMLPKLGTCRPQWEVFGPNNDFWNGFFRWDGGWYRNIVLSGYVQCGPRELRRVLLLYPYLSRWLGAVLRTRSSRGS